MIGTFMPPVCDRGVGAVCRFDEEVCGRNPAYDSAGSVTRKVVPPPWALSAMMVPL
jgi:hypothetical protein